ncbi:N-acetyltransferase [Lapidilactobacillus mulanensis]|uniref:N-acetyltransferase n=1 Tax=Lapidilactobacillus mulanensis TaxID=2485999 RepID=A0ABW4DTF2_9LACO|nr:N-acetyltransferase [Lapidilactobacillus mulanensis]
MLVKYKQDYEKIALGLLSFTPDLKDFERLSTELAAYSSEENRQLFLWKNSQGDFVGIVGVEVEPTYVMLRHLAFTPDYRHQATQFEVLDAVHLFFEGKRIMSPVDMSELLTAWERHCAENAQNNEA